MNNQRLSTTGTDKESQKGYRQSGRHDKFLLFRNIVLWVLLLCFALTAMFDTETNRQALFLVVLPVFLGSAVEFFRQSRDITLTLWLICSAFFTALTGVYTLLTNPDSSGASEFLLRWWPVSFVAGFVLVTVVVSLALKTTTFVSRISEGLVLAQSMGVVYILAMSIIDGQANSFMWVGLSISSIIVLVSLTSSFIMRRLPRWLRIGLSLWSVFVALIFAIRYIKHLLDLYRPDSISMQDGFTYFAQFLLFGSATMYIASSAILLGLWLFWGRSKKFAPQRNIVVQRFSNYQMRPKETIATIVYLTILFYLQYKNPSIMSATSIAWVGIATLPALFYFVRLWSRLYKSSRSHVS
ncbi:hypothetical protein IPL85_00440 [Candidatus Saccharibacteria bacterium]|nr:MAG: hypothetical protein IPL85_00440 [Candidatus Saccharibacteria bacterium]